MITFYDGESRYDVDSMVPTAHGLKIAVAGTSLVLTSPIKRYGHETPLRAALFDDNMRVSEYQDKIHRFVVESNSFAAVDKWAFPNEVTFLGRYLRIEDVFEVVRRTFSTNVIFTVTVYEEFVEARIWEYD